MPKKFITSALPYVNNQPHLGNIVGSVLGSDVYNRYCRKSGEETIFICGTDEYGTATEMEAIKQNVHPREIVEKNRALHKKVYDWINCEFDFFGQTSCPEHTKLVQEIFRRCYKNGYFEIQEVEQFYCEECAQFLADRYVEGTCGLCGYLNARGDQCDQCGRCLRNNDLKDPKCVICSGVPLVRSSNHLFLRLDLLQNKIKECMDKKKYGWSENAINIYNEWLEKDLISRCMTRTLKYKWGVPVPLEGFEDKVFYVWFDAVIGYLTFLSQIREDWEEWLKSAEFIQFMGKDNVFFHSFIFPGILLASDSNSPTVDVINSTEYLTFNKEKFSKSRGIGIFGMDLVQKDLGPSCLWRFYLIKRRPETKDSDFNILDFINVSNSDLLGNIGNLCQRILKYIAKNCGSKIAVDTIDEEDQKFIDNVNHLLDEYHGCMKKISLREGLNKAVEISSVTNKYIQDLQGKKDKIARGFQIGYSAIVFLAHILEPFIPETSKKIFRMCKAESGIFPSRFEIIPKASISSDIHILFNPLTEEQLANLQSYVQTESKPDISAIEGVEKLAL
ncbi:methionine-tRNA ligase [Vittaforma corneae ATCC 50505]|uniref:methionine--tRNA ligase n=1 Tax=Vittaforma corneae (strain ATCC 50505) TaxID=993615 RepID=L2GQ65_VITCO|nr:methionine-tRNA ligase [Vittaforma corneae ATCC 50505]ELA42620.1 methionine-tRNA ligase [Vittaforma corneae ATCC 50505]